MDSRVEDLPALREMGSVGAMELLTPCSCEVLVLSRSADPSLGPTDSREARVFIIMGRKKGRVLRLTLCFKEFS